MATTSLAHICVDVRSGSLFSRGVRVKRAVVPRVVGVVRVVVGADEPGHPTHGRLREGNRGEEEHGNREGDADPVGEGSEVGHQST